MTRAPEAYRPDASEHWRLDAPLHLRWTLINGHGPLESPVQLHGEPGEGGSWRGCRTPDGPAAVNMRIHGDELRANAFGPGASAALARVPDWLGLDDSPDALATDARWTPKLKDLRMRFPGIRVGRGRALSELLIPIVLAQRVTHEEAVRGYNLLLRRASEKAPGPQARLWLPPEPARIAAIPSHALRRDGIDAARARTLREVASVARSIDLLDGADPRECVRRLTSIRGIGPWSATIAVARAFGWADAVPLADYDLPSAVAWNLAGEREADDERMLELLAPFAGHRWRIIQLLVAGFAFAPRRAPRYRARGFAGRHRPPTGG